MAADISNAGRRFGHLTIAWTDNHGRKVALRCVCSRLIFTTPEDLQSGAIDSCGCQPLPGPRWRQLDAMRNQQKLEIQFHLAKAR